MHWTGLASGRGTSESSPTCTSVPMIRAESRTTLLLGSDCFHGDVLKDRYCQHVKIHSVWKWLLGIMTSANLIPQLPLHMLKAKGDARCHTSRLPIIILKAGIQAFHDSSDLAYPGVPIHRLAARYLLRLTGSEGVGPRCSASMERSGISQVL